MSDVTKAQLCIIGAGPGGRALAAGAAALKASVVLIGKPESAESGQHAGRIASVALMAAGKAVVAQRRAVQFGLPARDLASEYGKVQDSIKASVATIGVSDSLVRYTAMGVNVIDAAGRLAGKAQVEAGGNIIKARAIVITTGSEPVVPTIPGLGSVPYFTPGRIGELAQLPRHLVVIGAGAAGLELAQAFRRLGSAVDVCDSGEALADVDRELAGVALRALTREGVGLHTGCVIQGIEPRGDGIRVSFAAGGKLAHLDATHILVACGSKANLDGLRLETAGVAFTPAGIAVNAALQSTTNARIYAIGSAAGAQHDPNIAMYHAGLVLRHALLRQKVSADLARVPNLLLTDPEIATVGLSEREARKQHGKLDVLRFPFSENDRARIDGTTAGLIKVITTPAGAILGCGIAGPQAGELITPWTLAVTHGLTIRQMADTAMPWPALSEVSHRAALSWYAPLLARPATSRWLRLLRLWG